MQRYQSFSFYKNFRLYGKINGDNRCIGVSISNNGKEQSLGEFSSIHTFIVKQLNKDKYDYHISVHDDFHALISWIEVIAYYGINGLLSQSNTYTMNIIRHFILTSIIAYDKHIFDLFIETTIKKCKFNGEWHMSSLLSNVNIIIDTIQPLSKELQKKYIMDLILTIPFNPSKKKKISEC